MIRNIVKSSVAACALLGFLGASGVVSAAELVKFEGKVSVNRGEGFEPAKLGMVLKPGDQVLVGEKSAASLVYAEPGCVVEAAPASVVTVTKVGQCIPGQTVVQGKSALAIPTQDNSNYCDEDDDGDNECLPFFLMGGAAVIGATVFIIADDDDGQSVINPISP